MKGRFSARTRQRFHPIKPWTKTKHNDTKTFAQAPVQNLHQNNQNNRSKTVLDGDNKLEKNEKNPLCRHVYSIVRSTKKWGINPRTILRHNFAFVAGPLQQEINNVRGGNMDKALCPLSCKHEWTLKRLHHYCKETKLKPCDDLQRSNRINTQMNKLDETTHRQTWKAIIKSASNEHQISVKVPNRLPSKGRIGSWMFFLRRMAILIMLLCSFAAPNALNMYLKCSLSAVVEHFENCGHGLQPKNLGGTRDIGHSMLIVPIAP